MGSITSCELVLYLVRGVLILLMGIFLKPDISVLTSIIDFDNFTVISRAAWNRIFLDTRAHSLTGIHPSGVGYLRMVNFVAERYTIIEHVVMV